MRFPKTAMKLALSRKNVWDRLPRACKAAVAPVIAAVPVEHLLGTRFRRQLTLARAAEWWSADQARAYQLSELQRICGLAYQRTPYYRRLFDEAGLHPDSIRSVEDLRRFPTIDRHTLAEHLGEMCAVSPGSPRVDYVSTGGTGGMPLRFYIGADRSQIEYAYLVAGWRRAGFALGMSLAVLRGGVVPARRNGMRHEYDALLRRHLYSSFHMSEAQMHRYLEHLRGIGPCFLHVYPSTGSTLARFIRRAELDPPSNIRGVLCESEVLYPAQRRLIEETFQCRCFSSYGLTEKVALGAQCEYGREYHVWPTYSFVELLDEQGRSVTISGQRGEIVGTGFINTVVPFIRYRTGDYATYVADACQACGRAHMLLGEIRGHRVQEFLVAADGSEISWAALNMHDDTFEQVHRFQFYQSTPGRAILRIVPAPGFTNADRRRVQAHLGVKFDGRLIFAIETVDTIPFSRSGKAIYVDQRISGLDPQGCELVQCVARGGLRPESVTAHRNDLPGKRPSQH